ncbi:MAG: hypothetical protein ACPGXX_16135, partial [Planctomycetaceae bacterium]
MRSLFDGMLKVQFETKCKSSPLQICEFTSQELHGGVRHNLAQAVAACYTFLPNQFIILRSEFVFRPDSELLSMIHVIATITLRPG